MPRGATGALFAQDQPTTVLAIGTVGFGLALAMLERLAEACAIFEDLGHLAPVDWIPQSPSIGVGLHWGDWLWCGTTRGDSACGNRD